MIVPPPRPPTQVRHPWRTLGRTLFQLAVGIAPAMPLIVADAGLPTTAAGVTVALAISAVVTRAMSIPAVDEALRDAVPWLAAEPSGHHTLGQGDDGP